MGYPSRKKLHAALAELREHGVCPHICLPARYTDLSNEVYGREAYIYVSFAREGAEYGDKALFEERRRTEAHLECRGFKPSRTYCSKAGRCRENGAVMEIRVSYFKGYHWDE
jgi:hypothetical protein